ncbi:MAG: glycosyltransferase [Phycisphaerae bacterium]|nr:glycosyltransferase [Phycisphaerae bacterium]
MISVVVPAHNEQPVIARGLKAIIDGARADEIEVVVVCNGCTDRTAEVARSFGAPVRVIEIPQASKTAALNAGDQAVSGFPRFYVDADVIIGLASIRRMAAVLDRGDVLMANPELRMDLTQSSWPVRAFYRIWTALPYNHTGGMVGTGVYAVSDRGRRRWGRFPDVIADDGFVRFRFEPHERCCVLGTSSFVSPPKTLGSLVRVKTRGRLGLLQLQKLSSTRPTSDRRLHQGLFALLLRQPQCVPESLTYVVINLIARFGARCLHRRGARFRWDRDETTRAFEGTIDGDSAKT